MIRRGRGPIRTSSASRSSRLRATPGIPACRSGSKSALSQRHTYTVAYTLSETERDTEDFNFFPVDNRFYDLERGPASNDASHRVSAAFSVQLPWDVQVGTLIAARSKLPYNVTTGADDNRDTQTNDRPAGVGRNDARGATLFQADLRLTKGIRMSRMQPRADWRGVQHHQSEELDELHGRPARGDVRQAHGWRGDAAGAARPASRFLEMWIGGTGLACPPIHVSADRPADSAGSSGRSVCRYAASFPDPRRCCASGSGTSSNRTACRARSAG